MPVRIEWLDRASQDLLAILDYIARDSPRAAVKYVDEVEASVSRLAEFPEMGKRYDNLYRVLVVRQHLVFYRHDGIRRTVFIAAVIDGRRDLDTLLPRLLEEKDP